MNIDHAITWCGPAPLGVPVVLPRWILSSHIAEVVLMIIQ